MVCNELGHYRLVSVIYHIGTTMHQGHYRAALSAGSFTRSGSWQYADYLTDDGHRPTLATSRDMKLIERNCSPWTSAAGCLNECLLG